MMRGVIIVEEWRKSAHRALQVAARGAHARLRDRVLGQIQKRMPKGATLRELTRSMTDVDQKTIEEVLRQLIRTGEVEDENTQPGKQGGRPTTRYRVRH
jgi:hypothetical protein